MTIARVIYSGLLSRVVAVYTCVYTYTGGCYIRLCQGGRGRDFWTIALHLHVREVARGSIFSSARGAAFRGCAKRAEVLLRRELMGERNCSCVENYFGREVLA